MAACSGAALCCSGVQSSGCVLTLRGTQVEGDAASQVVSTGELAIACESHTTQSHTASNNAMPCHAHDKLGHLMPCCMSCHALLCHVMSAHHRTAMPCHASHATSCQASDEKPCHGHAHAMPFFMHDKPGHVMTPPWHALLHVMPCHAMPWYIRHITALPCHAMPCT